MWSARLVVTLFMFMQAADEAAVAEAAERLAAQTEKELGSGAVVPPVRKKIACPWGGPPPHPHILLPMPHRPRLARCLVSMFSHSHCIPPSPPIQMQSLIVKHIPNELDLGAERGEKGERERERGKGGVGRPGPVQLPAMQSFCGTVVHRTETEAMDAMKATTTMTDCRRWNLVTTRAQTQVSKKSRCSSRTYYDRP